MSLSCVTYKKKETTCETYLHMNTMSNVPHRRCSK